MTGVVRRGRDGTVWVVNRDRDEVAIFDATSGAVLERRPTGDNPHEVAISSRVDKAYITNETAGTISILSTRTLDSSPEIVLGPRPHHIEASRDGAEIVVGLVGTNAVAVIDGQTDQVSARYTSSTNQAATAHGPYLRGDTIYVAHESGGEVTAIDTADRRHRDHRRRDPPAERGAADPHRRLYVSARGEGTIKVIDLRTKDVISVPVGTQPETMLLSRDRGTLIVSLRGSPARLAFVDTRSLEVTPIDLAGSGSSGDLAAMSKDGRFVYATFDRGEQGTGGVAVVDVDARVVIDTWAYPVDGRVHGVAFSPGTLN